MLWPNGKTYDGEWKDDIRHGHGVNSLGQQLPWRMQRRQNTWPRCVYLVAANKYDGEWNNDQRHGSGVSGFANGEKYHGKWKDGKQQGYLRRNRPK
jgi:hypothetical protein